MSTSRHLELACQTSFYHVLVVAFSRAHESKSVISRQKKKDDRPVGVSYPPVRGRVNVTRGFFSGGKFMGNKVHEFLTQICRPPLGI